jgi:hypothetical protein
MPRVETLYAAPHQPLIERLIPLINRCERSMVAVGFMTGVGSEYFIKPFARVPSRLSTLVAGLPTGAALGGLDRLLRAGVPGENLWIHLGKVPRVCEDRTAIPRMRPMMHSKAFYFSMGGGRDVAIVGSNNLTGYALTGDNCELALLLEGDEKERELAEVREHILACRAEAVPYDPEKKRGFGEHTVRYLEGLVSLAENELPDEGELKPTLVVLTAVAGEQLPVHLDVVYLELPRLLPITTVGTEVHLYLFDEEPVSNEAALASVERCRAAWRCRTLSTGIEARTAEGRADWHVRDAAHPRLERTKRPFRPDARPDKRQVFILLENEMKHRYRYEFNSRRYWELVPDPKAEAVEDPWRRVIDLKSRQKEFNAEVREALAQSWPTSRNFVLLSDRRHLVEGGQIEMTLSPSGNERHGETADRSTE